MTRVAIFRYLHQPGTGEALNVAMLGINVEEGWVEFFAAPNLDRVRGAFGIETLVLRRTLKSIGRVIDRVRANQPLFESGPVDAITAALRANFPDPGSALRIDWEGDLHIGGREVFLAMAKSYVVETGPSPDKYRRRDDSEVERTMLSQLQADLPEVRLQPHTFKSIKSKITVEHTFLNGKINWVEPISLDYATTERMSYRISEIAGTIQRLKQDSEYGRTVVIYGSPGRVEDVDVANDLISELQAIEQSVDVVPESNPPAISLAIERILAHQ